MNKKVFIGIILFLGLFGLWAHKWDRIEAAPAKGELDPDKVEILFQKIGILRVPHLKDPIQFNLKDVDGKIVKISDYRGKIVFLNFWTTWCPACRIEMPAMEKLHQKLKDKDFVMIAVSLQESAQVVRDFFQKYKLTFIALLDSTGEVGRWFGVRSIPTTYILGRDGKVLGAAMGAREWDSGEAIDLFEYLTEKKMKRADQTPEKPTPAEGAFRDRG